MPWTASARRQYARPAARYATDLTDAEFALLAPHLPAPSRVGRPREVDLREVLDAILYLLRTGCPWRLLPKSFPPKSTVFGYFRRLWEDGTWPTLHALLVMAAREQAGREASPSAGLVDSQSVGADDRERRPEGLRRRQEGERAQAARPGRHARPAAGARRPHRRHPGSRRAGAGLPPPAPPLSVAPADLRRRRLPGRDRRLRGGAGGPAAHDRHARPRHTRLRRPAAAMGGNRSDNVAKRRAGRPDLARGGRTPRGGGKHERRPRPGGRRPRSAGPATG